MLLCAATHAFNTCTEFGSSHHAPRDFAEGAPVQGQILPDTDLHTDSVTKASQAKLMQASHTPWHACYITAYLDLVGDALLPSSDGSLAQGQVQVLKGTGSLDTHLSPLAGGCPPCLEGIH